MNKMYSSILPSVAGQAFPPVIRNQQISSKTMLNYSASDVVFLSSDLYLSQSNEDDKRTDIVAGE